MNIKFDQYPDLDTAKNAYQQRIDEKAVEVKSRFATVINMQGGVYIAKAEDAINYKNASNPTNTDYPYIYRESQRSGESMTTVADRVLASRDLWRAQPDSKDPAIEAERVTGKAEVRATQGIREAYDVHIAVIVALDAI